MKGIEPRLTARIQKYDPALYVYRNVEGKALIMRQGSRLEDSDYGMDDLDDSLRNPQLILALTDNWRLTGKPVDWGMEPILDRLRSMDSWRDDKWITERKRNRERDEETQKQSKRNEFRAIAADLRKEFAQATNDINTSTLEKVDGRRNHGNC